MKNLKFTVTNPSGLHARPATELVKTLKTFHCAIQLQKGEKTANPKSLISLLKVGIVQGDAITFQLDGPDEADAEAALNAFFGVKPQ